MVYKVLKQFQPGSSTVWVEKLSNTDTVDIFDTEVEAENKKSELQSADTTRKFKVVEI